MDVVAENGRDALVQVAHEVLMRGHQVSPRGQVTVERRHLSVEIRNPYDALCTGINANQSTEVAAAEAIQLIGAFSDVDFAVKHAPKLAAFVNPTTNRFDGAYGPRAKAAMFHIVARLVDDPDTRQAILPIWSVEDVLRANSVDYPCTLTLGFFIRDSRLELDVMMRSNDVNWGFKNDIFQFSQLQLTVAHLLGIPAGSYRHTALSMHIYERDFEWAMGLGGDVEQPLVHHPRGIDGAHDMTMTMTRARRIADGLDPPSETPSESWYRKQLTSE